MLGLPPPPLAAGGGYAGGHPLAQRQTGGEAGAERWLLLAQEEGSSKKGDKATGRPQRARRRTGGKASQMLAHLGGCRIKGEQSF